MGSAGIGAERAEALAGALGLVRGRVLVDDELELDDRLRLLAELEVGEALPQVGRRRPCRSAGRLFRSRSSVSRASRGFFWADQHSAAQKRASSERSVFG